MMINEKTILMESGKNIRPYEGRYVFYDMDDIKRFNLKNKPKNVYYFFSTHEKVYKKKVDLNGVMSLRTRILPINGK